MQKKKKKKMYIVNVGMRVCGVSSNILFSLVNKFLINFFNQFIIMLDVFWIFQEIIYTFSIRFCDFYYF